MMLNREKLCGAGEGTGQVTPRRAWKSSATGTHHSTLIAGGIRDVTEHTVRQTSASAVTSAELAALSRELGKAIGQFKLS